MAGTLPPLFAISDEDHGGYVAVAVYTLLVLSIFVLVTRLSTRWYIGRVIHADDILLAASAICGLLQSVFVQLAISDGLGKKRSIITNHAFDQFLKHEYAAQILLIITIALSKISSGLLFQSTMTSRGYTWANGALMVIIVAWAIGTILALALRCPMPNPWKWSPSGQCINQEALFQSIAALNISTDVALVVLPCILLRNVQLSRWKRFRIMALIASKLMVCAATGVEIHHILIMLQSSDVTWASTNATVWDQVMMNLSIITTALPSLGRLVVELQPNVYAFKIHDDHTERPSKGNTFVSTKRKSHPGDPPLSPGTSVMVTSGWRESFRDDSESVEGLVNQPNVIQQTIHFEVH
ncbi:hypothetical protein N7493_000654 [Penicillium malachiteum]|uniref:Rhodopsin domain-containing protein n=1 Tax=Penicillium malachiteum TaxID=1324776 RepID=A0AAD6HX26_9EURO|nr:hypothetical protein N7493_000654 [Penicillium malachiteum]